MKIMAEDRLEKAIELAKSGDPGDGIRLLWPDMLDEESRDQVLFAMAYCFEKATNFATANYLYEELALRRPGFEAGVERQQKCRQMVEEKGLIEDFTDMGHRDCLGCSLRYRAEYLLCPYCGTPKDSTKQYVEKRVEAAASEDLPGWEDHTLLESVEEMGRDAADRIQEFVESDTVKKMSDRVVGASMATGRKAKELAKHEKVKEAKDKTVQIGKGIFTKAEKLSENPTIQDLAKKIEDTSWKASDKMKEMLSPENKKKASDNAKKFGQSFLKKVRDVVDPPKKEPR